MPETPRQTESSFPEEIFFTQNQTIALQTRLILGGEALNPNKKDLPKIDDDQLTDVSPETYNLLSSASTQERHQFWQKKGVSEDEAYKQWQQELVKFVNNPKKKERKQTLSSLKLQGITINWENFSSQEADLIYQRYFADKNASSVVIKTDQGEKLAIPSSVDKFVSDIIFSYTEDGKVNLEKLNRDLPVIKAFANIFGENSSEILEAVILAKAKLLDPQKKQELITRANEEQTINNQPTRRVNYLNGKEEELLRWLLEYNQNQRLIEKNIVIEKQNIGFNLSYEQNRKAADRFISILRDPKHLKPSPNWPKKYLVHDYGFVFDDYGKGGTFDTPELLAKRYSLPFATYTKYLIPKLPHATLVIRGPRLDPQDNQWKIVTYDPYHLSTREETLEGIHTEEEALAKISFNKLWEEEYHKKKEDLSFANDPELKPYLEVLTNAKLAPFQQDSVNCYLYCFFVASMLNALKQGKSEFKTRGLTQFANDFQLNILTREELLGKGTEDTPGV